MTEGRIRQSREISAQSIVCLLEKIQRTDRRDTTNTSTAIPDMTPISVANPITLEFEELKTTRPQELFPRLLEAFGDEPDCLGIVVVDMRSVPEYISLRKTLLSYSSYLAALPPDELQRLENAHSKYVVGWSHGKEKLKSGAVDIRKGLSLSIGKSNQLLGSYYVNPTHDAARASEALKQEFPEYTDANIWPPECVLPGFRDTFQRLGQLIVNVAALLAKVQSHCSLQLTDS
jgi:hypothetical protein